MLPLSREAMDSTQSHGSNRFVSGSIIGLLWFSDIESPFALCQSIAYSNCNDKLVPL